MGWSFHWRTYRGKRGEICIEGEGRQGKILNDVTDSLGTPYTFYSFGGKDSQFRLRTRHTKAVAQVKQAMKDRGIPKEEKKYLGRVLAF